MAILLGLAACLNDSPTAGGPAPVRATFRANVIGAQSGGAVRIRVGYRTRSPQLVFLPSSPQQVTVGSGSTIVQPVTVDIRRCLADPTRLSAGTAGCKLLIELTLADPTGTSVDSDTSDASGPPTTPGGAVDFGTVTVGAFVATVAVNPPQVSLNVGQEQQLTATPRDAKGTAIPSIAISWTTSDPTVAQLSATTGSTVTVRALKPGESTVTASARGKKSPPISLGVVTRTLAIRQRPASGCVIAGQTVTLEADSASGPITWSSSDPSAVTVDPTTGVVTGVQPGQSATITATSVGGTGTATVCVAQLNVTPATLLIIAARTSQLAVTSSGGAVTFASSAAGVATVDATGLVRGVNIGQATITTTITAASGTKSVPVTVTVNAAGIVITSKLPRAPLGRSVPYSAVVTDADGAPLPNASPKWTVADPSIATLSPTSGDTVAVQAVRLGLTTVSAAAGGVVTTAPFTATPVIPATRLEAVSGNGASCPTYSTKCTLIARAVDVDGFPVTGNAVQWSTAAQNCSAPKTLLTDENGLTAAPNLCSAALPGFYEQTAALTDVSAQVAFHYALRGLVLTLQTIDTLGVATYSVTSDTPAEGLSATITYTSGPATSYVTRLDLNRVTTPAVLVVGYDPSNLPTGAYSFDITVSTTTPDLGPGVATELFQAASGFVGRPNVLVRPRTTRIAPPAPLPAP